MNTKYQNQGLGSKIIRECMEALRKQGYKKIKIGVDKKIRKAIHSGERMVLQKQMKTNILKWN